jgi:tRNA uridine 5-carboxymethylaminomethyl modification enzyme
MGKAIEHEYSLADLLRRPDVSYQGLMSLDAGKYQNAELVEGMAGDDVSRETTRAVIEQVEIAAKYSGYIDRQRDEVQRAAQYENLILPESLDYEQVTALSIEVRQRLTRFRPETLGQASRLSGITPAAISLLLIHLKRSRVKGFSAEAGADAATSAQASAQVTAEAS